MRFRSGSLLGILLFSLFLSPTSWAQSIREASVDDLDALFNIEQVFPAAIQWDRETHLQNLMDPNHFTLLAELDGNIVGTIIVALADDSANIDSLGVLKSYQRHGIGRKLMNAAIEKIKTSNRSTIDLQVDNHNTRAIGLYITLGFEEVGQISDYYGPGQDALDMRLDLAPTNDSKNCEQHLVR